MTVSALMLGYAVGMAALGILPKYKSVVVGKTAKEEISEGEPIFWENL